MFTARAATMISAWTKSLATTPPRRPWIRLWTISATTVTASTTATATRWRSRSRSCVLPWRRMPTRNISQPRLRPTYPKNPWRTSASTHRSCRALRWWMTPSASTITANILPPFSDTPVKFLPRNTPNYPRRMTVIPPTMSSARAALSSIWIPT